MLIIGVDFHPEFQQIASVDTDTGDFREQRLQHREGAEKFYRTLAVAGQQVRVGMGASGHARWFERLLAELRFELWIGDATQIRSKRGRKQKRIAKMRSIFCSSCRKMTFPRSGCRTGRIEIYGNCCGIDIAWCKRALES